MLALCPDYMGMRLQPRFSIPYFVPQLWRKIKPRLSALELSDSFIEIHMWNKSRSFSLNLVWLSVVTIVECTWINKDQTSLSCVLYNKLLLSYGSTVLNNHIVVVHFMEWANEPLSKLQVCSSGLWIYEVSSSVQTAPTELFAFYLQGTPK